MSTKDSFDYPWPEAPLPGTVLPLRAGVNWVRMPLPFALDHINVWLVEDELVQDGQQGTPGYTQIDCGITSPDTLAAWEQIFETVLGPQPLLRVIATHFHPDHLGLAWWLTSGGARARWRAPLLMSATEYLFGRALSVGTESQGSAMAMHFARHGLSDPTALEKVRARGAGYYPKMVPKVPNTFVHLYADDVLTLGRGAQRHEWRVIVGHGHAPEHVSLYCEAQRILITGDMVLPRISTNVGVFDLEPEANPLPRYLDSLQALRALPADTLVLPSHGLPFVGLHERIDQQQAHHRARLDEVLAACATPQTAADIVPVLFRRPLDLHQTTFALGEALAHLHMLWFEGKLCRTEEVVHMDETWPEGPDRVYRFAVPH